MKTHPTWIGNWETGRSTGDAVIQNNTMTEEAEQKRERLDSTVDIHTDGLSLGATCSIG